MKKTSPLEERDLLNVAQPLDRAWTIRTDGIRVPAPMRKDIARNDLPLDRAWTTMQSDAYGSGPRSQT